MSDDHVEVISSRDWNARVEPQGPLKWLGLCVFLGAVLLAAGLSVLTSLDAADVYADLHRPIFAPPQWLFGPAWSVLYVFLAVSGWLVWVRCGIDRWIRLWIAHIVLNGMWTPLFFGLGLYWIAFVELCVMWVVLLLTTLVFRTRHTVAMWLLVPNLLWVAFAGALNFGIALLN